MNQAAEVSLIFGCGRRLGVTPVPEENGLDGQLKKRKLAKYWHWKRRSEGLVMVMTEREIEGKFLT